MAGFWKRLEHKHIKPHLRRLKPYQRVTYGEIAVHYTKHLDGGGTDFGQDFIPFLRSRGMPPQPRAFEWCAGPGFIGFSLLAHGLCDSLCLADINRDAVAACRSTIRANGLAARVAAYRSDNLKDIPLSEAWDLVVSNPPHFTDLYAADPDQRGDLRCYDGGWNIHRDFFAQIGTHLKPGSVIVLQENNQGSTVADFRDMIENAGFAIAFTHGDRPQRTRDPHYYYIGIVRAGGAPPVWARG